MEFKRFLSPEGYLYVPSLRKMRALFSPTNHLEVQACHAYIVQNNVSGISSHIHCPGEITGTTGQAMPMESG
jgi:hypothetical protein